MSTATANAAADVLVVEDDADLREVLAECLRLEGYRVAETVDGSDALNLLRSGARPALIFLDLIMPRMDGRQFLGMVRDDVELARIPVVLVTGTPPQDLAGQVVAVLKKPIGINELLGYARRYVQGGAAERPDPEGARPASV